MFIATLAYELDAATSPEAHKLLRAELVGRRYNDRKDGKRMPANCARAIRRPGSSLRRGG